MSAALVLRSAGVENSRTRAARTHFDRWSTTYEQDRASRRLRELQRNALGMLALTPDDVLLDLGCGTGAAVRDAAATVTRAVGFDLSPAMIARARELAASFGNAEFVEGDVSAPLPFADGEFTAILCTNAFHHFPEHRATVAEIVRVLAPTGRLVIADANRSHPAVLMLDLLLRLLQHSHVGFRSPGQLRSDLRAAGLIDVTTDKIWGGGYAFVRGERQN